MTFGAQLFLLAALAGVIPVVIHMRNRQKAKHLPFPTLRFLRISVEKTRRRKRIHDVLLMLLRALVLVLIAVGLARPTMTNLTALLGSGRSAVVVLLDNSASMGMIDQGRSRFETATAAAEQVLAELKEGEDEVALLPTSGPPLSKLEKLDRTQAEARRILGECRVSYQRADLAAKLRQARKLLAASTATNKHIYVITDMQANAWEGLKTEEKAAGAAAGLSNSEELSPTPAVPDQPAGAAILPDKPAAKPLPPSAQESLKIPVILVDCHRAPKPNVAVQSVVLETAAPVAGLPVKATVALWNTSSVAQQRLVELYIDGVKDASSPELSLPPQGRVAHDFVFSFRSSGLHRGEVRLAGDDGCKFDDRRYFAAEIDPALAVAVVKSRRHEIPYLEEAFYLEQALAPGRSTGWAVQTSTLVAADLLSEALNAYKVIFCVDLPAPDAEAAERLANFVEQGGSLVWICGDHVVPAAYNDMNQRAGGKLLPAPLLDVRAPGAQDDRDSWHITFLDRKHPALRNLVEPASLYQSVLVYKHVRLDGGSAPEAAVLARLDDGEPLLVERKQGQGKVLMWGSGAHVGWSNVPLRPLFLPLFARLTFYLAGAEQTRHETIAGAPLLLRLDGESHPVGVEVLPPSGETLRLTSQDSPAGQGQIFRYSDTHAVGVYQLRLLDASHPARVTYAVNVDPEEADPATLERTELQRRLGGAPLVFAENPDDLSSTFKLLREGRSLWGLLLSIVLAGLVFETFLSNRLTASPPQRK